MHTETVHTNGTGHLGETTTGKKTTTRVHVVITRNTEGETHWSTITTRSELKKFINTLLQNGGQVVKVFAGARELQSQVKQVISF